ncbi:nicotinate-nucleotide--dimethylbenzimidazole phosphoribosyltransferase [Candidatus Nitrospira bockiana]
MDLQQVLDQIPVLDRDSGRHAQQRLDRLTKPVGSLGRLEDLAVRYVEMTGDRWPKVPQAAIFTFAADHGIAAEGVSAYPAAVTAQMVLNFLRGGAGVNVLARHIGAEVRVIDIGVAHDFESISGLIHRKIAPGTNNCLREPAMTRKQAEEAVLIGAELARGAALDGVGVIGTGDMGIGNTTASAAITAVITGATVRDVTGRGTGIDDATFEHKVAVLQEILALHHPDPRDPLDVLAKVGGFEIGGLAGLILGAAAHRVPVVLDGFIAGAAALIAVALAPRCQDYLIASHRSVERGHEVVLQHLGLAPLLDLGLRLGEGTGACLGIGLLQASIQILTQMATFDEAGVSERV